MMNLEVKGKQLSSVALVLPPPKADMLIRNDILRLFKSVEITYNSED